MVSIARPSSVPCGGAKGASSTSLHLPESSEDRGMVSPSTWVSQSATTEIDCFEVAKSLLALDGNQGRCYFHCVVCDQTVYTAFPVLYRIDRSYCNNSSREEKEIVWSGRKHCTERHPETLIWNIVPPTGIAFQKKLKEGIIPEEEKLMYFTELLLHKALSHAAERRPSPLFSNITQICINFGARILAAENYIRNQGNKWAQRIDERLCYHAGQMALRRHSEIEESVSSHLQTDAFRKVVDNCGYPAVYNEYQLYFLQPGRYRHPNMLAGTGTLE